MRTEPTDDAMLELYERSNETIAAMVEEWRSSTRPVTQWKVVPAARLIRIWQEAAELGVVRDENELLRIADRMIENTLRIAMNNVISGHDTSDPEATMGEYLSPDEQEAFVDWAIDTETGGWRISDYGIRPLFKLAALLLETHDAMEKIVVIDRMLNVTHPRSDLASWFVEGGSRTLDVLASRPSELGPDIAYAM